jgi:sulfur transfer protein SufE
MLLLPNELAHQISTLLDRKGFSSPNQEACLKWLRFIPIQRDSKRPSQPDSYRTSTSIVQTSSSWVFVFDTLNTEIKIRHYAPKTLKAYRGWTRHFQTFTQSKNYRALTQQDMVDFLSYLAVEKQVTASSQNQAFNALLFLYQHVLKK